MKEMWQPFGKILESELGGHSPLLDNELCDRHRVTCYSCLSLSMQFTHAFILFFIYYAFSDSLV